MPALLQAIIDKEIMCPYWPCTVVILHSGCIQLYKWTSKIFKSDLGLLNPLYSHEFSHTFWLTILLLLRQQSSGGGKPVQFSAFSQEIHCEAAATQKATVKPLRYIPLQEEVDNFSLIDIFASNASKIRTCLAEVSS